MKKIAISLVCLIVFPLIASAATDTHRQAAEQLLLVTNSEKMMERVHTQMEIMTQNIIKQSGVPAEKMDTAQQYMQRIMDLVATEMSWDKLKPQMIDIYVEVYTESELSDIVAFYQSPAGKKFIAKMPELVNAAMKINQATLQKIMPKIQAISEEMLVEVNQESTHCGSPQDKATSPDSPIQTLC